MGSSHVFVLLWVSAHFLCQDPNHLPPARLSVPVQHRRTYTHGRLQPGKRKVAGALCAKGHLQIEPQPPRVALAGQGLQGRTPTLQRQHARHLVKRLARRVIQASAQATVLAQSCRHQQDTVASGRQKHEAGEAASEEPTAGIRRGEPRCFLKLSPGGGGDEAYVLLPVQRICHTTQASSRTHEVQLAQACAQCRWIECVVPRAYRVLSVIRAVRA